MRSFAGPVAAVVVAATAWAGETAGAPGASTTPPALQPGDIILIPTSGPPWNHLGRPLEPVPTPYGHVGIAVRDRAGWRVVHAEGSTLRDGGIVSWPLARFVAEHRTVAVVRLDDDAPARDRIAREAARSVAPTGFDTGFRWGGDAVYCTEFVYRVIRRAARRDLVDRLDQIAGRPALSVGAVHRSPHVRRTFEGTGRALMEATDPATAASDPLTARASTRAR